MRRLMTGVCLLVLALPTFATAQTLDSNELITDRPDFTESSEVVGRGMVQLESGFALEGDESNRAITTPTILARIGLTNRMELRVSGDGFMRTWDTARTGAISGHSDFELGAKVKLLAFSNFAAAVIPMVSIPTNDPEYSTRGYDPMVKATWATTLPRDFDLSGNVNWASPSDVLGHFTQTAVSVSLGHELVGGWGAYWEGYAFTPMERNGGNGWTLNSGVTHGIGPNMQFDIEAGRGVTRAAPDWFFSFGFAIRRPFAPRR